MVQREVWEDDEEEETKGKEKKEKLGDHMRNLPGWRKKNRY